MKKEINIVNLFGLFLFFTFSYPSQAVTKSEMKKYPQTLVNVKTNGKLDLDSHSGLNKVLKTVNSGLGKNGRVLIRPSGTEPIVRVMVECNDADLAKKSAKQLAKALKS